jgi:hypothetical protein
MATISLSHCEAFLLYPHPQSNFILNNVLVAPSLIHNLLPVHQFTRDNHYSVKFDALGFSLKISTLSNRTFIATSTVTYKALSTALWHCRLIHPAPNAIHTHKICQSSPAISRIPLCVMHVVGEIISSRLVVSGIGEGRYKQHVLWHNYGLIDSLVYLLYGVCSPLL